MKYDIIVLGGGLSGTAAAISAARAGLKTLIIEKSGFLGGAAGNCYINPFMPFTTQINGKVAALSAGLFTEILKNLKSMNSLYKNTITFNEESLKLILDEMTEQSGVDVLFHSLMTGVEKENGKIKSVRTFGKSGEHIFEGDYFIDATGDADLAFLAGCPYRLGRDEDGLCQPMTLCFRIAGVDTELAWKQSDEINAIYSEFQKKGKIRNPRENVLKFPHMADGVMHINSTRVVKLNPVDVFDLSKAEREGRKQAYELYMFLKNNIEAFKNSVFLSSAPEIGVRESRMIDGEYKLTVEDIKACTKFEDRIAACNYPIDIHNPIGGGTEIYRFKNGEYYTIPYRCMLPKGIDNMLVTGRCISTDHETQASYRIMPVCCNLGEAAGSAVYISRQSGKSLKNIDVKKLQEKLLQDGAFL